MDGVPVATPELTAELIETIGVLRRHLRRRTQRPWSEGAVSSAQAELIRLVRRQPGISVAAAATELGVAANTVSTLVRSLVSSGLLVRTADPDDRRVARLDLTPATRRQVERWRDERAAVLAAAVENLSTDERAALAAAVPVLGRLAAGLRPDGAA